MGNRTESLFTVTRTTPATYFDSSGIMRYAPFNTMRQNYDWLTDTYRGILVEESRTNLLKNSTLRGGTAAPTNWSQSTGTGTSTPTTSTISSIGTAYYQTATNERPYIAQAVTTTVSSVYTMSFYIEAITGTFLWGNAFGPIGVTVTDVRKNGVSQNVNGNAEAGFIEIVFTAAATSTTVRFGLGSSGSTTGTMRFSCPQVELGAFASSFIPTSNAVQQRNSDIIKINALSPWYNPSEGALYVEWYADPAATKYGGTQMWLGGFGTTANDVASGLYHNTSVGLTEGIRSGVSNTGDTSVTSNYINFSAVNKAIVAYSGSTHKTCLNGGTVVTGGTNFYQAAGANVLAIGQRNTNLRFLNAHIRKMKYYSAQPSDARMQALTA